jgi:hypothetical protein
LPFLIENAKLFYFYKLRYSPVGDLIPRKLTMYKDATYKEKYAHLSDWMPSIIEAVKKDLKNEHLKKDFFFIKKFLSSKNMNKVTVEELVQAYSSAIAKEENGEELGEFITARWLFKNSELYDFFERYLSQLTTDFTSLEELDHENSDKLIEASIQQFGASNTYIFSVLNSVVFPQAIFHQLKDRAHQEKTHQQQQQEIVNEKLTLESLEKSFEREIARLVDKYEKKLSGLQKKYLIDTESLKKQIAHLQRKLQEKA